MKKKDIILLVVCFVAIGASVFFMYKMLNPTSKTATNTQQNQNQEQKKEFTGEIDEKTLEELKKLNDYGEATLDNIGKANPFGPLN